MGSLTEISVTTRKLAVWLAIGFAAYLVLKFLFGIGVSYWKATHIPPLPPPNVLFSKLPAPKFPDSATNSAGLKFVLQNIEGRPPETTASGKVYYMPKKKVTIASSQRAKTFAAKLGFTDQLNSASSSSTYYYFTNPKEPRQSLEIDITYLNFKLKYDYQKDPEIFTQGSISSKEQALNEIKNFIGRYQLFESLVTQGKITTNLLKFESLTKSFSPSSSLSNANAIRVNYFRNDIDGLRVLPPLFDKSYTYVLYTAALTDYAKIPELVYTYWPIALDNSATYPLRDGKTAWQNLTDGYGTIINLGNNSPDNIIIRNIYLAYYDSEQSQIYLQPIFVFEGDNNFVAYLPAIASEWLE